MHPRSPVQGGPDGDPLPHRQRGGEQDGDGPHDESHPAQDRAAGQTGHHRQHPPASASRHPSDFAKQKTIVAEEVLR